MQTRLKVLRLKTWRFFYTSVHVLLHLLNEMRKLTILCKALPRMLSFIINKWNIVQFLLIANAIFYLCYDIFAFSCIDKSPNCQESSLILLKNSRHIEAYV